VKPRWHIWLFLLPGLVAYVSFKMVPTFGAIFLSMTEWTGLSTDVSFAGFGNYTALVKDPGFHKALGNSLKFTLTIMIFQTLISLGMAMLAVRNTKINVVARTVFFMPVIISSVSIAFIWTFMYDANVGVINALVRAMGLPGLATAWLSEPNVVLYALAFVQIWTHAGQLCIIFVAGLQTIPESLYEAAAIEGAGRWQVFRFVTWPLLAPATAVVVTLTTIGSFKVFDLIWVMTQGGPAKASDILSTFIYTQAFGFFKFGYAATAAVIFLVIIASITILQFKLLKAREVSYQ
jgi:raffinose/stachyose/melibiose transport system permease protein